MRNDPSFQPIICSTPPSKSVKFLKKTGHPSIMVHKTNIASGAENNKKGTTKTLEDPNKGCSLHKKPHPRCKCRGFRKNLLKRGRMSWKTTQYVFAVAHRLPTMLKTPRLKNSALSITVIVIFQHFTVAELHGTKRIAHSSMVGMRLGSAY